MYLDISIDVEAVRSISQHAVPTLKQIKWQMCQTRPMCPCDHVLEVGLPGPARDSYKLTTSTLAQISREYVEPSTVKVKL
jgi:hypothetical protein